VRQRAGPKKGKGEMKQPGVFQKSGRPAMHFPLTAVLVALREDPALHNKK